MNLTPCDRLPFALALALLGAFLMFPGSTVAQIENQVVNIPVGGKFPGGTFTGTLDLTSFAVQNGQLVAQGLLSGTLVRRNGTVVGAVTNEQVAIPVTDLYTRRVISHHFCRACFWGGRILGLPNG
jgi:hypothetical protein